MRVIEETGTRLVMVHRPWATGIALVAAVAVTARVAAGLAAAGDWPGAAMIGGGAVLCAGALFVFVRPSRVTLDRAAGTLEVVEWTAAGRRLRSAPLADVTGAAVNRGRETFVPGGQRGARAVVTLRGGGSLPLADAYMARRPAARAVAAIERWLGRP